MNMDSAMEVAPEKSAATANDGQYVTFNCCGNAYGIDIMAVREIRSWVPTTSLPSEPHAACGVLDIRGEIVQVYDLAALLGTGRIDASGDHVVLVISLDDQDVGILADSVSDIIQTGKDDMRLSPKNSNSRGVVKGLVKHEEKIVTILDLEAALCL